MNAIELEQRLLADHRRLEKLCFELQAAFDAHAREDTQARWFELERSLEAHFTIEERLLFPRYAHFDATETRALAAEHRILRALLEELDVALDLEQLRSPVMANFLSMLRAHAAREDAALYRWASEVLHDQAAKVASALAPPSDPAQEPAAGL